MADGQVALPFGVVRVGGGQPGRDVQVGLVGGPGRGQVPGRDRHVPQLVVADGQVALPFGVVRVGGGQPDRDVQAGLVGGPGRGQVPGRDRHVPQSVVDDGQEPLAVRVGGVSRGAGLGLAADGL